MGSMPRVPDTFIIGAPKTGTTSLHAYLQDHPQVFMSRFKEPGYFAPDVTGTRPTQEFLYPQDEGRYLALFAQARDERRVGESSTNYLMSTQAPSLIRAAQPDARLIAMLRNPVDLVYSLHNQRVSTGTEPIQDFAEALDADDDRRRGLRLPDGPAGLGIAYRDNAMVGAQLERWLSEFPRSQFHLIVYEDFSAATEAEYRKVIRFLDLDEGHRPIEFKAYNASHRQRRGPIAALLRNRGARWVARTGLPAVIGERGTNRLGRLVGRRRFTYRRHERPPLPAELRARLEDEFAGDVRKLGDIMERDLLSEWFAKKRKANNP